MKDTFDQYKWFKNQYLNENESSDISDIHGWIKYMHPDLYLSDSISYDDLIKVVESWTNHIKQ